MLTITFCKLIATTYVTHRYPSHFFICKASYIKSEFLLTLILYSEFVFLYLYTFIFLNSYFCLYTFMFVNSRNSEFPSNTNNLMKTMNVYSVVICWQLLVTVRSTDWIPIGLCVRAVKHRTSLWYITWFISRENIINYAKSNTTLAKSKMRTQPNPCAMNVQSHLQFRYFIL